MPRCRWCQREVPEGATVCPHAACRGDLSAGAGDTAIATPPPPPGQQPSPQAPRSGSPPRVFPLKPPPPP
ncbi:MAG: hypothetical protein ACYC6Y_26170, partial [Thermoguttaceae bacterium]